jgi:hypothetical protein
VRNIWSVPVQNWSYVTPVGASVCHTCPIVWLSQGSAPGKPGSSATALRLGTATSAATILGFRPIVLGYAAAALGWLAAGNDSCAAGDRCSLAPGGVQVVLDLDFSASNSRGTLTATGTEDRADRLQSNPRLRWIVGLRGELEQGVEDTMISTSGMRVEAS